MPRPGFRKGVRAEGCLRCNEGTRLQKREREREIKTNVSSRVLYTPKIEGAGTPNINHQPPIHATPRTPITYKAWLKRPVVACKPHPPDISLSLSLSLC